MGELWPEPISDHNNGKVFNRIGFTQKTHGYQGAGEVRRQALLATFQEYGDEN